MLRSSGTTGAPHTLVSRAQGGSGHQVPRSHLRVCLPSWSLGVKGLLGNSKGKKGTGAGAGLALECDCFSALPSPTYPQPCHNARFQGTSLALLATLHLLTQTLATWA